MAVGGNLGTFLHLGGGDPCVWAGLSDLVRIAPGFFALSELFDIADHTLGEISFLLDFFAEWYIVLALLQIFP